jgi:hypothetical protein
LCGKWSLIVLCGVFGEEGTIDVSRTWRGLERSSYISFFLLFTPGQWAGLPRGVLAFQIFFLTSLPPPSPPCILPVYQGLRPSALLIFYSIGLSKKEKKKCFAGYML